MIARTTVPPVLLPEQRRYLEHIAQRLAPHVPTCTEALLPADPAARDEMWRTLATAALDQRFSPRAFYASSETLDAITTGPGPTGEPMRPHRPGYHASLYGIPLHVAPEVPTNRIVVEHHDGRHEFVQVTPARKFATYRTPPIGAPLWRRILARVRRWRP